MADGITSAEGRLLAERMGSMRDNLRDMKDAMRGMATSMEKLVRIEEQQTNMRDDIKVSRDKIETIDSRVAVVERDLPGLRELRKWVIGGVLAGLAMMGTGVVTFIGSHLHIF